MCATQICTPHNTALNMLIGSVHLILQHYIATQISTPNNTPLFMLLKHTTYIFMYATEIYTSNMQHNVCYSNMLTK